MDRYKQDEVKGLTDIATHIYICLLNMDPFHVDDKRWSIRIPVNQLRAICSRQNFAHATTK